MIETEQSVDVAAPIDVVWDYVRPIAHWADMMPGLVDYQEIDADRSHWTLKIGAGALVRTVRVAVEVTDWNGPHGADFSYYLEGDPVQGTGRYRAEAVDAESCRLTLFILVEGSGKMAPMWEALGKPLLPRFAAAFAASLRDRIEAQMSA